jgi:hypothetical protein
MKKLKYLFVIFLVNIFVTNQVMACGNYVRRYYDSSDLEKYFPFKTMENILNSDFEIVSSKWGSEYAYFFYRELLGKSFTDKEKALLLDSYKDINKPKYLKDDNKSVVNEWYKARGAITDKKVEIKQDMCDEPWSCYEKCHDDTFRVAIETLKNRKNIYNKQELKTWLKGQDDVFNYCDKKIGRSEKKKLIKNNKENQDRKEDIGFIENNFIKINQFFKSLFSIIKGNNSNSEQKELFKYDQEYQIAAKYFAAI